MGRFLVTLACVVGTKVVHNHLTIHKFDEFPREWAVPWPEKPAVCSLVVRVVVLRRTICWKLRASKKQLAIKVASTPFDIAVALHSGAVCGPIAVFLTIMACKIFEIIVGTCGFAKISILEASYVATHRKDLM